MRNPIRFIRERAARRRYMPRTRTTKASTTAWVAVALLVLILGAAALLDLGGPSEAEEALAVALRDRAGDPLALVERAGRSHRFVFLADIAGTDAPERFAAEVIGRLALGPGLDAVALFVDEAAQAAIDRYLVSDPEDVAPLLASREALDPDGGGSSYLALYRRIRAINDTLGADRRIRIVAMGPGSARVASPARAATRFAERDERMLAAIDRRILERQPRARVLFLVDGLSALRLGGAVVQSGGTARIRTTWLAARLAERTPGEVFSILVDAPGGSLRAGEAASYTGTAAREVAGSTFGGHRAAIRITDTFRIGGPPVRWLSAPGLSIELVPAGLTMDRVADAYLYLGR
jgi:hypothetical protein